MWRDKNCALIKWFVLLDGWQGWDGGGESSALEDTRAGGDECDGCWERGYGGEDWRVSGEGEGGWRGDEGVRDIFSHKLEKRFASEFHKLLIRDF